MNRYYFKANFNIARKSKKNLLLVGLLIIFMAFFLFVVEAQKIGDGYRQWRAYAESVEVNADYFDGSSLRKKDYKQTYDNLNKQSAYIAELQNSEVFSDPQTYLKGSENLIRTMLAGYQNNYKGARTLIVPAKYTLYQKLATYKYLYQHHIPIVMNSQTSATYLVYILSLLGSFIFLYILFISNDIWIVKLRHITLLKNIPYRNKDEILGKVAINLVLTLIPTLIGMLAAYVLAGIRNGFITLNYPHVFYFTKIGAIPLWIYGLAFLAYCAIVVIFTTALTLFLNQLTKNVYLTMLLGILVYIISYLPGTVLKFLFWLPSPYLNVTNVLTGTVANTTNLAFLNCGVGALILLIWSLILMRCFSHLVNKGSDNK